MNPTVIGWLLCADLTFSGTRYRSGTILTDEPLTTAMRAAGLPMIEVLDDDDELNAVLANLQAARAQDAGADFAQFVLPLVKKSLDDLSRFLFERFGFFNMVGSYNPQASLGTNAVQTQPGQPLAIQLPTPTNDPSQLLGTRVLLTRIAYDGGPTVTVGSLSGQPVGFAGDNVGPTLDISGFSSVELTLSIAPGLVTPPSFYWHVVSTVPFPT